MNPTFMIVLIKAAVNIIVIIEHIIVFNVIFNIDIAYFI